MSLGVTVSFLWLYYIDLWRTLWNWHLDLLLGHRFTQEMVQFV